LLALLGGAAIVVVSRLRLKQISNVKLLVHHMKKLCSKLYICVIIMDFFFSHKVLLAWLRTLRRL